MPRSLDESFAIEITAIERATEILKTLSDYRHSPLSQRLRSRTGRLVVHRIRIRALQNCSCDRTSFGGRASSSQCPFYIWHWQ